MANIKIILECPLFDGMPVTFKAPCDCTAVEGLTVAYGDTSQTFTFRDAHGNDLTGIGNLFEEGAYVKAVLDTVNGYAYLQNADTNAYLEGKISTAQTTANSKASTVTYTVSVPASWTEDSTNGGYYQTVTVSGILSTDNPIADVVLGSDIDANAVYLEAWAAVTRITTAAGSITLYANGDAPTTAFTCQLKTVR